jgi:lysophospholipase L1-like esterase
MGRDHHLRCALRRRGTLLCILVVVAVVLPGPAAALAARLYVAVGDSVGAGFGATSGQSYFNLYCGYLKSAAGGSLVDQCVNESVVGLTSQSALDGGTIQKVVNDIDGSTDTPVITVVLGGNDLLGSPGCQPITGASCNFIHNMRTILDELETALATHPGPHVIQWLEYYNPNHDNPFGNASADQSTAALLLGNDFALTACSSYDLTLIGLNDAINCIAREKGATPVDAHTPFQNNCTNGDCFSDSLHPDDKGYGLIFDAFRDTPGSPVPTTPPPDGSWPIALGAPPPSLATISALSETRKVFAPSGPHHKRGTVFSFRLDQPAKVTIAIQRHAQGRRVGRSCRYPSPRLRHKPPCTRTILIAALSQQGHAGLNKIAFSGRVGGRALKPGRYLAVFAAIDRAGASSAQTLHFRIVTR